MQKFIYSVLVPAVLVILPFAIPKYSLSFDVATVLTVVSLLFTILVGFFISAATSNYLRLQSLISNENGSLSSIFNLCKLIQPSSDEKIREAIDRYCVASLNYELEEYIDKTEKSFRKLLEAVDAVKGTSEDKAVSSLMQILHQTKIGLIQTRREISLSSREIVSRLHWIIIGSLAVLISIMILTYRDGVFFSTLVLGVLIAAIYLVLKLIYEIDRNTFAEEKLSYLDTQSVFASIGELEYYPEEILSSKRVRPISDKYRIGVLKQDGSREIKTINL